MKTVLSGVMVVVAGALAAFRGKGVPTQVRYTLKVPGGLAFSQFEGYESWQIVSTSQDGPLSPATPS